MVLSPGPGPKPCHVQICTYVTKQSPAPRPTISIDWELQLWPIRDLLPSSYRRALPRQTAGGVSPSASLRSIVAGRKTATARYRHLVQVGPAMFVFDDRHIIRRLDWGRKERQGPESRTGDR
jgi:hypothetical protein